MTAFEIITSISSVVVALAALVALIQLRLTVKINRIHSKRAGITLAGEQCRHYLTTIVPEQRRIHKMRGASHSPFIGKADFNILANDAINISVKEEARLTREVLLECLSLFDLLEAFAVPFIERVADERAAFKAIGPRYCKSIALLLPVFAMLPYTEHNNNTLRLFAIWSRRLQKRDYDSYLARFAIEPRNRQDVYIQPLGTE